MPKYYVTRRSSCLVDFVTLVEADDATQAKAIVDENPDAGEYCGCSIKEQTSSDYGIPSVDTEFPGVEFCEYACIAEDMHRALRFVVGGYDSYVNGNTNSVPLAEGVNACRDVLERCQPHELQIGTDPAFEQLLAETVKENGPELLALHELEEELDRLENG